MNKISGAVSLLALAAAISIIQIKPASADVVINNVLSPFTSIQVGPGYRAYGRPDWWWVNNPYHHQRCYRRWDPYFAEWQEHCVRMHYYGRGERYYYRQDPSYYRQDPYYRPWY
jgi:hypothetical protein